MNALSYVLEPRRPIVGLYGGRVRTNMSDRLDVATCWPSVVPSTLQCECEEYFATVVIVLEALRSHHTTFTILSASKKES